MLSLFWKVIVGLTLAVETISYPAQSLFLQFFQRGVFRRGYHEKLLTLPAFKSIYFFLEGGCKDVDAW